MERQARPDPGKMGPAAPSRRGTPAFQTVTSENCPHNVVFDTFWFRQKGLLKFLFLLKTFPKKEEMVSLNQKSLLLFMVLEALFGCATIEDNLDIQPGDAPYGGWSYKGEEDGPQDWALDPKNWLCAIGSDQSPVDLDPEKVSRQKIPEQRGDPSHLQAHYNPTHLSADHDEHNLHMHYDRGSTLDVGDEPYSFQQFHFHAPSEHTIQGQHFSAEIHLVHEHENGDKVVVGIFVRVGQPNPLFEEILMIMPQSIGHQEGSSSISLAGLLPAGFLPKGTLPLFVTSLTEGNKASPLGHKPSNQSYFIYMGSLTTPTGRGGCEEGVKWFVFETPIEVSEEQLVRLTSLLPEHYNARPTQPLHDRKVMYVSDIP